MTWFQNNSFSDSSEDMIHDVTTWKNVECFLSDVFKLVMNMIYVFLKEITCSFSLNAIAWHILLYEFMKQFLCQCFF